MQNARTRDYEFKAVKKAREEEQEKFKSVRQKIMTKIDNAIIVAEGQMAAISIQD